MSVPTSKAATTLISGVELDTYDWRAPCVTPLRCPFGNRARHIAAPYAELRYNFNNGADKETVDLNQATIELGGFRVGAANSQFTRYGPAISAAASSPMTLSPKAATSPTRSATPIPRTTVSRHSLVPERGKGAYLVDDYLPAYSWWREVQAGLGFRLPVLSVTNARLKNGPARFVWT